MRWLGTGPKVARFEEDFAGRPCDMPALLDVTRRHGLVLIEDCAHVSETEHGLVDYRDLLGALGIDTPMTASSASKRPSRS